MNNILKILYSLLLIAGALSAQQYVSQDGHLLDANNRIGSMGWNSGGSIDALNNRSNNMMTGNILGGQSFRGAMPYRSTLEFQGISNINTLSNFRRDSTGVGQTNIGINSGQLFIDSSKGVTGSFNGNIVNTQNINQISTQVNPRLQVMGYSNSLNNSLSTAPLTVQTTIPGNFTSISQYKPYQTRNQGLAGHVKLSALTNRSLSQRESQRLNYKIDSTSTISSMPGNALLSYDNQLSFDNYWQQNQDQVNYDEKSYLEKDLPNRIFEENITGNRAATEYATTSQMVSQYQSYFDQALENMKRGRYYKAADDFGIARIFAEKDNASIIAYSTIARFATGEYISSSLNLYQAFDTSFDQTMAPIDLKELFDSDMTVYYGVKDLERCYKLTGNASLLFLQGYIEFIAGDYNAAHVSLQKLLEISPENKLYQKVLKHIEITTDQH